MPTEPRVGVPAAVPSPAPPRFLIPRLAGPLGPHLVLVGVAAPSSPLGAEPTSSAIPAPIVPRRLQPTPRLGSQVVPVVIPLYPTKAPPRPGQPPSVG